MQNNLLTAFLSLAICLAGLEIGLRALGPKDKAVRPAAERESWLEVPERVWTEYHSGLGWYHIKNKQSLLVTDHVEAVVSTNSAGFRGAREYAAKKTSSLRLLALGDSFTFGFGVGEGENFAQRLEYANPELEVLNLGVSGFGIDQILLSYRLIGREYRPDYVFIGVFPEIFWRATRQFTDAGYAKPYFFIESSGELTLRNQPVPQRYALSANQFPSLTEPQGTEVYLIKSALYRFVKSHLVRVGKNTGLIAPDLTPDWNVGNRILDQLIREIRADGAKPVILIVPPERWVLSADATSLESSTLRLASRTQTPVVNMAEVIRKAAPLEERRDFYIPGDGHWSVRGHEIVAQTVAKYLAGEGALSRK